MAVVTDLRKKEGILFLYANDVSLHEYVDEDAADHHLRQYVASVVDGGIDDRAHLLRCVHPEEQDAGQEVREEPCYQRCDPRTPKARRWSKTMPNRL